MSSLAAGDQMLSGLSFILSASALDLCVDIQRLSHAGIELPNADLQFRPQQRHPVHAVVYFQNMKETEFEERFDRLEKKVTDGFARMEAGFTHVNGLIETLANTCAREFADIAAHFTVVDKRLDDIDGKIEAFAHRVDFEVEERHKLGERVSKLEQSL
jgi:tetrahydromethanopterin S-methyltransferase subunit G